MFFHQKKQARQGRENLFATANKLFLTTQCEPEACFASDLNLLSKAIRDWKYSCGAGETTEVGESRWPSARGFCERVASKNL